MWCGVRGFLVLGSAVVSVDQFLVAAHHTSLATADTNPTVCGVYLYPHAHSFRSGRQFNWETKMDRTRSVAVTKMTEK